MQGFFGQAGFTVHKGQTGGRGLSPRLWSQAWGNSMSPDGLSNGYFAGDDFLGFGGIFDSDISATQGIYSSEAGSWYSYQDSGATILAKTSTLGGVIKFLSDGTDNDETSLQLGGPTSASFVINKAAGYSKKLVFEARFKVVTPTTNATMVSAPVNLFIGLAEEGAAVSGFIDDSGDLADKDYIGFAINEDAGDTLAFIYKKNGQTMQTPIASVATDLVPGTWYKCGFIYDPDAKSTERIKVYFDNELIPSDAGNDGLTDTVVEAATFPDAQYLNPILAIQNSSGVANEVDFDWVACYQDG